jgi:hypothetical protein
MALDTVPLPFGLREVKITPYTTDTATTLGTGVKLPNSRTFSFTDVEDFEELRGDDEVQSTHGKGATVDWELEGGGIALEAWASMAGGTVNTTGVSPNQVKTYRKSTDDVRPWFKIEGRAISDSGGDFHGVVWRCRATGELTGEMADGAFWMSGASGRGIKSTLTGDEGALYDFVQNETSTAIA